MRTMRMLGTCLAGMLVALTGAGCTDDGSLDCSLVLAACETMGATQCTPDGAAVLRCDQATDGCLAWVSLEACDPGETCQLVAGAAACSTACLPDCAGRVCGDDGCDGSCGECDTAGGEVCVVATGTCEVCAPDCTGRVCGADPVCGASCGECAAGESCDADGLCQPGCSPDCQGRECGMDPVCGTLDCGACDAGESCDADGLCQPGCSPD
ncbi:MAG TPA: hypothetical protein PK668_01575, partial [Myxococcota bacterium]|nr:hypothetical protein [Myxococcota bacterium]HRY97411.1 hypothetical protein [Myxococcota bacterium]